MLLQNVKGLILFFFFIVHYDRILVMDDGNVAEFDSALRLFDRSDSLFRALCDEAQLSRGDIMEYRTEHGIWP